MAKKERGEGEEKRALTLLFSTVDYLDDTTLERTYSVDRYVLCTYDVLGKSYSYYTLLVGFLFMFSTAAIPDEI